MRPSEDGAGREPTGSAPPVRAPGGAGLLGALSIDIIRTAMEERDRAQAHQTEELINRVHIFQGLSAVGRARTARTGTSQLEDTDTAAVTCWLATFGCQRLPVPSYFSVFEVFHVHSRVFSVFLSVRKVVRVRTRSPCLLRADQQKHQLCKVVQMKNFEDKESPRRVLGEEASAKP